MKFEFSHDGHTYAKRSDCAVADGAESLGPIGPGEPTRVRFLERDAHHVDEPQPLEPSGDLE